ncbi:hypothetical protein E2320_000687 [Naja naja]|nr:hypothetical protein E2320_000687 [Naja naja]
MFHECVQSEQLCTPRDRSCFSSTIKLFYLEIAEYVMKGCSGEGVSNRTANVYSEDDHEVHNTYYCDSNLCNIRFTGAPTSSVQEANGMECYSCFDRGTGDCDEGNATRVKCLGDMNQCMDFTVINGAWKMTYRTCALETLCRRQYMLPELSGRLEISCCSTPLCNDGRPGLKSICSHFSEQGQGECAHGNWTHVKCVGEQTKCVNVTEKGHTLMRGCSLEKLCWEKPQLLGLDRILLSTAAPALSATEVWPQLEMPPWSFCSCFSGCSDKKSGVFKFQGSQRKLENREPSITRTDVLRPPTVPLASQHPT